MITTYTNSDMFQSRQMLHINIVNSFAGLKTCLIYLAINHSFNSYYVPQPTPVPSIIAIHQQFKIRLQKGIQFCPSPATDQQRLTRPHLSPERKEPLSTQLPSSYCSLPLCMTLHCIVLLLIHHTNSSSTNYLKNAHAFQLGSSLHLLPSRGYPRLRPLLHHWMLPSSSSMTTQ